MFRNALGGMGVKGILKPPRFGDVGVSRAEGIGSGSSDKKKSKPSTPDEGRPELCHVVEGLEPGFGAHMPSFEMGNGSGDNSDRIE